MGPADCEAAAQAHINAVSGACLALGIKYAGTASKAAADLLHSYVMYLLTSKQAAPDPVSGKLRFVLLEAHSGLPRCSCSKLARPAAADLLHSYVMYLLASKQAAHDHVSGKSSISGATKQHQVRRNRVRWNGQQGCCKSAV